MSTLYSDKIRAASVAHYRPGLADTSALDLQAVAGEVAAAVEYLEGLTRGAQIEFGSGVPAGSVGQPGDAYFDYATGDVYGYDAGSGWEYKGTLRGQDGKTPRKGVDYFDGKTPQLGIDYKNGKDGTNGLNAWELYQQAGGTLDLPRWLESLQAEPGKDAVLLPESVTNEHLAADIKVGSLKAAANAYPATDRTNLTTIEKYLVWIGGKISDIFTRINELGTADKGLDERLTKVENRSTTVVAAPGTGTGGGTASYPAQGTTTVGKFLQSTGAAGGEQWAAVVNNRVGWVFAFKNELSREYWFYKATTVTSILKNPGISSLTYSINGATAVTVVFTADSFTPGTSSPLVFPAGSNVAFAITYSNNYTTASFRIEGTEAV